jgi:hypothetical protein
MSVAESAGSVNAFVVVMQTEGVAKMLVTGVVLGAMNTEEAEAKLVRVCYRKRCSRDGMLSREKSSYVEFLCDLTDS